MQSKVVVDGGEEVVGIVVVGGTEVEIEAFGVVLDNVERAVVLGTGVVGHGLGMVSTLQDALQSAT